MPLEMVELNREEYTFRLPNGDEEEANDEIELQANLAVLEHSSRARVLSPGKHELTKGILFATEKASLHVFGGSQIGTLTIFPAFSNHFWENCLHAFLEFETGIAIPREISLQKFQ